ncbi:C-type lectin 37Da [Elysia marginata]|uniref:C-type lectin 37Da n=1 Tax=Elysia marginata TaxID=1093978 RepID=A0AAV4ENU0_9GAST|nr:C-type lectin 37Da [Elysia marginata]
MMMLISALLALASLHTSQAEVCCDMNTLCDKVDEAINEKKRFNLMSANDACKTQGGYLLELEDNKERDFTYSFVKKIAGDTTHFGTGGNDVAEETTWVYYNSGKPVPTEVTWLAGEPNNSGNKEDCMVFWMSREGLNDITCDHNNIKYVCEIPLGCEA